MKITFFLPTGFIEWPVPEALQPGFNFSAVASKVRMDGYFMAENFYLRHDCVVAMAFSAGDEPIPQFQRPAGMTMQ